LFIDSEID